MTTPSFAYAPRLERPAHWTEEALCGKPEYRPSGADDPWYSFNEIDRNYAKEICAKCPVKTQCAELSEGETHGIWAGINKGTAPRPKFPCTDCGRALRPRGTLATNNPGTIVEVSRRRCGSCTNARPKTPAACVDCGRKLRPRHLNATDAPGTLRHSGHGRCSRCYKNNRKNKNE